MLANSPIAAILPCVDMARARQFYGGTLGLPELPMPMPTGSDNEPVGVAYECGGGTMLFVYVRETPTKADHTAAGWMVVDLDAEVDELLARGVTFEVYADMPDTEWDDRGIASFNDYRSVFLKDPEGNILAINEVPE